MHEDRRAENERETNVNVCVFISHSDPCRAGNGLIVSLTKKRKKQALPVVALESDIVAFTAWIWRTK